MPGPFYGKSKLSVVGVPPLGVLYFAVEIFFLEGSIHSWDLLPLGDKTYRNHCGTNHHSEIARSHLLYVSKINIDPPSIHTLPNKSNKGKSGKI